MCVRATVSADLKMVARNRPLIKIFLFALLYLWSDSTTVPLADAKLSGPRDAFEKMLLIASFSAY